MREIDIENNGLKGLSLKIPSLTPSHFTESVPGKPGVERLGVDLGARTINGEFYLSGVDRIDWKLIRDKVFSILDPTRNYYLIDSDQMGKRWHVVINGSFLPEKVNHRASGVFEIPFETYDLPFSESVNKSSVPMNFDNPNWQIGMGLIAEDTPYTFNTSSFKVYNPGNIPIDIRYCEIDIIVKAACSTYFELENQTSGELFKYTGALTTSDTLKLSTGKEYTKNSLNVFRNTNRQGITLMPGWNDFIVKGASSIQQISFDTRFYYAG